MLFVLLWILRMRSNMSCISCSIHYCHSKIQYIIAYVPPVTQTSVHFFIFCIWSAFVPLRKENFLRNPGVTKESAKQRRRPLNSSPVVLMLTEWGLELTKHTVTYRRQEECDFYILYVRTYGYINTYFCSEDNNLPQTKRVWFCVRVCVYVCLYTSGPRLR